MANDWSKQIAGLEALAGQFKPMQRKALGKVVAVVKPRLAEAAPVRVSAKQGGNSLQEGALKAAVRGRIHIGDGTSEDPSTSTVDFGKLNHIANFVDGGHNAPGERSLTRAGATSRKITHRPTPPKPFVRQVQDGSADAAQSAFEQSMTQQIEKALNG